METVFSRTASQQRAKDFLAQSISSGTFHQALLIYGPAGVGQTPLLLDTAEILLCDSGGKRPCGTCSRCLELKHRKCDNFQLILPMLESKQKSKDARIETTAKKWDEVLKDPYRYKPSPKEYISINQIRDLKERLSYSEIADRKRIVLILWSEAMPPPAANALLKILEEPPPNTFFMLGTENKITLLPTIISRCALLNITPLSEDEMKTFISGYSISKIETDESLLPLCAGSPGTFLELDNINGTDLLNSAVSLLNCLLHSEWPEFTEFIENQQAFSNMEQSLVICNFSLEIIREALYNGTEETGIRNTPGESGGLNKITAAIQSTSDIDAVIRYYEKTIDAVSHYGNPKAALIGNFMGLST